MSSFKLLFLCLLPLIGSGIALQCYTCTASIGHAYKCENITGATSQVPYNNCFYADSVCAKYVIQYRDSVMVHRNCQHRDICSILNAEYNNIYSHVLECYTCNDRDYCNSGNNLKIPFIFTFILFIIYLYLN